MKRTFTVFDAFVIMLMYFKWTNTGMVLCWPAIFLPYMIEGTICIILAFSNLFGWPERIKYWFWKFILNRRIIKAGNKARSFMEEKFKEGQASARRGNPGKFIDPQNIGK